MFGKKPTNLAIFAYYASTWTFQETVTTAGRYHPKLTLGGCSNAPRPFGWTAGDAGTIRYVSIALGEEESVDNEQQLIICPNPSHGNFELFLSAGTHIVEVFNSLGKNVWNRASNDRNLNVNAELKAEIYLVRVIKNNQVGVKRLVVE
jgi:hypothetical protein